MNWDPCRIIESLTSQEGACLVLVGSLLVWGARRARISSPVPSPPRDSSHPWPNPTQRALERTGGSQGVAAAALRHRWAPPKGAISREQECPVKWGKGFSVAAVRHPDRYWERSWLLNVLEATLRFLIPGHHRSGQRDKLDDFLEVPTPIFENLLILRSKTGEGIRCSAGLA